MLGILPYYPPITRVLILTHLLYLPTPIHIPQIYHIYHLQLNLTSRSSSRELRIRVPSKIGSKMAGEFT